MRWRCKWDESYLTRTPRGERKRREEGENTNTNTPGPLNGQTLKRQEKRNCGGRRAKTKRPAEGGEDSKRLNQPNKAKPDAYLRTRRTQTYLTAGSNAWNRGPMGASWWNECTNEKLGFSSCLVTRSTTYALERASGQIGLKRLKTVSYDQRIGAQFAGSFQDHP